jgi:hypothetical protein
MLVTPRTTCGVLNPGLKTPALRSYLLTPILAIGRDRSRPVSATTSPECVDLGRSPEWTRPREWSVALSLLLLAFLRSIQILCLQRSKDSDLAIKVVMLRYKFLRGSPVLGHRPRFAPKSPKKNGTL